MGLMWVSRRRRGALPHPGPLPAVQACGPGTGPGRSGTPVWPPHTNRTTQAEPSAWGFASPHRCSPHDRHSMQGSLMTDIQNFDSSVSEDDPCVIVAGLASLNPAKEINSIEMYRVTSESVNHASRLIKFFDSI